MADERKARKKKRLRTTTAEVVVQWLSEPAAQEGAANVRGGIDESKKPLVLVQGGSVGDHCRVRAQAELVGTVITLT